MANPPRKKGTKGETDLKALLEKITGRPWRRTSAGAPWDLETADTTDSDAAIFILATRPDRGYWLLTMDPWAWDADITNEPIRVEVKRRARLDIHTMFDREKPK